MKEIFFSMFEIVGMCKNSLRLRDKANNTEVFIHRESFNLLMSGEVENIRTVPRFFGDKPTQWVEVLAWK